MYTSELAKIRYSTSAWVVAIVVTLGVVITAFFTVFSYDLVTGLASGEAGPNIEVLGFGHAAMQWSAVNISGGSGASVGISTLAVLIFGLLNVTTEFRYGSMATTLLANPSRTRAILAKAGAIVTAIVVIGLVQVLITAGALAFGLVIHGVALALPVGALLTNWAIQIAGLLLMALIGMGLGLIVRSQVAGLVVVFAWVFVESILRGLAPLLVNGISAANFLPIGLGPDIRYHADIVSGGDGAAVVTGTSLAPAVALIALIVWMIGLVGSGAFALHRRDIPA